MVRKHPEVIRKGKTIDISDLESDPYLLFQHNNYRLTVIVAAVIIPTVIPMYFWCETYINAVCLNTLRFVITLNTTLVLNSIAHILGTKPYDK